MVSRDPSVTAPVEICRCNKFKELNRDLTAGSGMAHIIPRRLLHGCRGHHRIGGDSGRTCAGRTQALAMPSGGGDAMNRRCIYAVLTAAALLLGPAGTGFAAGSGARSQGGHGAHQPRGVSQSGFHGHAGAASHRPFGHDRFRGHTGYRTRVFIGSGFSWGAPWWWWEPAYPYYAAPPVVVLEAPPVYIQPEPAAPSPSYWYYRPNPASYYPYIKECPVGWLTVVPPANSPPNTPTP
jgi:hypothetical protein